MLPNGLPFILGLLASFGLSVIERLPTSSSAMALGRVRIARAAS
jgi:hypothetical protein